MESRRCSHVLTALCLVSIAGSSRASVLTVSMSGTGGTFSTIQAAVNAASDEDTILVRPGNYAGFAVDHKSLFIAADPVGSVTTGAIQVNHLAGSQHCSLSGLSVQVFMFVEALAAHDNAGALRCEAMQVNPGFSLGSNDGVGLYACAKVAFVRCTLRGNATTLGVGGIGLAASDSNIALYDCSVEGARGYDGYFIGTLPQGAGPGAAGCQLWNSVLFASDSTISGGDGGSGTPGFCFGGPFGGGYGASGGAGLGEVTSTVDLLDTNLHGGHGGIGGARDASCGAPAGTDGAAGANLVGAATRFSGTHKKLTAPTLVRENDSIAIRVEGTPGDEVWLATSMEEQWQLSPSRKGVILVGAPTTSTLLGIISGSGFLSASLPVGDLGPGVESSPLFLQASCIDPNGLITLTSPALVVLLDQSF